MKNYYRIATIFLPTYRFNKIFHGRRIFLQPSFLLENDSTYREDGCKKVHSIKAPIIRADKFEKGKEKKMLSVSIKVYEKSKSL